MSASNSTPRALSTRIPPACAAAWRRSAVLPIPGSPRRTSAELTPRRASARARSMRATSGSRPSNTGTGWHALGGSENPGGPPDPKPRRRSYRHRQPIPLEVTQMAVETQAIDQDKLMEFIGQVVGELGATVNAGLIVIGDRLRPYHRPAGAGPTRAAELAD